MALGVVPAGGAVARRGARHRDQRGIPADVEGRDTRQPVGGAPGAVLLGHHEHQRAAGTDRIVPASAAVARRRARHRSDPSVVGCIENRNTRYLDRGAPGAVRLADDKRLPPLGLVLIHPAGAAITRRRARDRVNIGAPGLVEGRGTGNLLRDTPPTTRGGPRNSGRTRPGCRADTGQRPGADTGHHSRNRHCNASPSHPITPLIWPRPGDAAFDAARGKLAAVPPKMTEVQSPGTDTPSAEISSGRRVRQAATRSAWVRTRPGTLLTACPRPMATGRTAAPTPPSGYPAAFECRVDSREIGAVRTVTWRSLRGAV